MNDKRLMRSENQRISGVCAGIAEFLNIDPTLVRLAFVLLFFAGVGTILPLYIVLALVMPTADEGLLPTEPTMTEWGEQPQHEIPLPLPTEPTMTEWGEQPQREVPLP